MLAPGCLVLLFLPLIGLGIGHYVAGESGMIWGAVLGLLLAGLGSAGLLWLLRAMKSD